MRDGKATVEDVNRIMGGSEPSPPPREAWECTVTFAQAIEELEQELRRPAQRAVRTPYARLNDHLAGGFYPGQLVYLAARPGLGKSAMLLHVGAEAARDGEHVLVISAEMPVLDLARRLAAREARVDSRLLRKHDLMDTERARLATAFRQLKTLPAAINDRARTIPEIVECLRRATPAVTFLAVDYLQLLTPERRIDNQRAKVETVSGALKSIAREFSIPVLALSSVKRLGRDEDGNDNEPDLDALRESGQLDHDADVALMLHRPTRNDKSRVRCFIRKARDAAEGVVDFVFTPEFLLLEEELKGEAR